MFRERNVRDVAVAALTSVAFPMLLQAAAAPGTGPAAEAAQAVSLEEVVVTARRREENLLTVPIAVSVMTSEIIEDAGVKDIKELAAFTPGLFAQNQDSSGVGDRRLNQMTFRGLSTSSGAEFIDGSPVGARTPAIDVTDLARVEVLKGPQSVYFGRSTFAGAVNYVTKTPGDEFAGRVSGDVYSYDGVDMRGMVEAPLLKDGLLSVRLNVRKYSFGGQYHNGSDQTVQMGEESTQSGSLSLFSKPNEHLNLTGYYSHSLEDDGPGNSGHIRAEPVGKGPTLSCNLGGTGGPYWCGELPKESAIDPLQLGNYGTLDAFTRNVLFGGKQAFPSTFAVDWKDSFGFKRQIDHFHVRADLDTASGWDGSTLLSFTKTKLQQITDRTGLDTFGMTNPFFTNNPACLAGLPTCIVPPRPQLSTNLQNLFNDYSAEVRVSSPQDKRLRGTLGVSYYKTDGPPSSSFDTINSGGQPNTGTGGVRDWSDTPAVFGGLTFGVTDRFKLSAEARYQWDKIARQSFFGNTPPATVGPKLSGTFKSFSPRLTAEYTLPNDSLLYGSFSRGYRPGGFNVTLLPLTAYALSQLSDVITSLTFDQERLDNYEIGHKGKWLDGRLRTTLAVYQMNWINGQVSTQQFVSLVPNGPISTVMVTQNLGKVRLRGVELETDFAATNHLTVAGTLNYASNQILNYVFTPGGARIRNSTNVTGNTLPQAPKMTVSLSPTYAVPLSADWKWATRLDYLYRSKIFVDATNVAWIGARGLVNLNTAFNNSKGFKIAMYANNLLNDDTFSEASSGSNDAVYAPNTACPPCINLALPPVITPAVSVLNIIGFAPPVKRTIGVRASYDF